MKNSQKISAGKTGIKTVEVGKQYIGICVVRKKEFKSTGAGDPFLQFELGDWSGRLKAKIWKDQINEFEKLRMGDVIKIKALVQTYNQNRELRLLKFRRLSESEEIDFAQLFPQSQKDIAALKNNFFEHISNIENHHLKELLASFFYHDEFSEKYFMMPAGKLWHHNYLYGMLEHVVTLLDLAGLLKIHYPQVNIDLLKTAIICHDIGKVKEFGIKSFIDYTDEGRLTGHLVMGYYLVRQRIGEINDFPADLEMKLLHAILSHQGEHEKGSPVLPMTLEAFLLHLLDEVDSKVNALTRIIEKDRLPDSDWSKFIPLLNRFIFIGRDQHPEENQNQQANLNLNQQE